MTYIAIFGFILIGIIGFIYPEQLTAKFSNTKRVKVLCSIFIIIGLLGLITKVI